MYDIAHLKALAAETLAPETYPAAGGEATLPPEPLAPTPQGTAARAELEAMRARAFDALAPLGAVPSQRLAGRFRGDPAGRAYYHGRIQADGLVRFSRLADVTLAQAARIIAILNEGPT
jgi:hypothetical protein